MTGSFARSCYFGHAEEPLDVLLVFDTSASMLPAIARVADVSRAALGELRPGDHVAVMAFDEDTDLIADGRRAQRVGRAGNGDARPAIVFRPPRYPGARIRARSGYTVPE
jgi:hypothetical protein